MAVWGVWWDGRLWFSTGGASKKARNLGSHARCVITTERADEAVVVEGTSRLEGNPPADIPRLYGEKYGMGYPDDSAVFAVTPLKVFGFIEAGELFSSTATRWSFEGR